MTVVLALDVGSSRARAQAYDERGEPVGAQRARELAVGEQLDADALVAAVRDVVAPAGTAAIAVSCFWHSLVPVDRRGRALAPLSTWRDLRAAAEAERLARELGGDEVHARTGCPLHASFWPAKLALLARERPDVFRAAARFLGFAEYLHLHLTGTVAASVSSASGTGLLRADARGWDEPLLDGLGLEPDRLPPLSDEPAELDGVPAFPGLGDGACSNLGVGAVSAGRAALMLGTSGALRTVTAPESPRPHPGLFLLRLDGRRAVEGGSLSDGGNLVDWLERTLRLDRGAALDGEPGEHAVVFLPLLGGERAPGWNGSARGAVAGLSFQTTPLDLLQAALEGVALRFVEIAARLPGLSDVVATGRAALARPAWLQILADALGLPVTASAVAEGSARGAAVYALQRLGVEPEPAPLGAVFKPRAERTEEYRALLERQRRLYEVTT